MEMEKWYSGGVLAFWKSTIVLKTSAAPCPHRHIYPWSLFSSQKAPLVHLVVSIISNAQCQRTAFRAPVGHLFTLPYAASTSVRFYN